MRDITSCVVFCRFFHLLLPFCVLQIFGTHFLCYKKMVVVMVVVVVVVMVVRGVGATPAPFQCLQPYIYIVF